MKRQGEKEVERGARGQRRERRKLLRKSGERKWRGEKWRGQGKRSGERGEK